MNWKRLENADDDGHDGLIPDCRVFSKNGRDTYPRISVSIYRGFVLNPGVGVKVNVSGKEDSESWWVDWNLPDELVPELIEMLKGVV